MTRRRRHSTRSGKASWNAWTWVWIAVAIVLVLAMALRRAPLEGSSPAVAGVAAAESAGEADAGGAEDFDLDAWLAALRRPDRREAFLAAAAHLEERWHADEAVPLIVRELLELPQYSSRAVWRFVTHELRDADLADEDRIRQRVRTFEQFGGLEGYRRGLRLELRAYVDRNRRASDRQQRLLEIIGDENLAEPPEGARVGVSAIEQHTLARFIDELPRGLGGAYEAALAAMLDDMASMTHDVYHPIDRAIGETHDYVALAISRWLWSAEHAERIRKYMRHRLDRSELYGAAIRQMLGEVEEAFFPE